MANPTFVPIWKDVYVNLTSYLSSSKVTFDVRIYNSSTQSYDTTIYTGVAYADTTNNCKVKINDLCAPYLSGLSAAFLKNMADQYATEGTLYWSESDCVKTFGIFVGTTMVQSVVFSNDWSYRPSSFTANQGLSLPINPVFCIGMPVMYDYANDSNGYTAMVILNRMTDLSWPFYAKCVACGNAALYYRNSYGGIDFLLLAGLKEKQAFSRNTLDVPIDNATLTERGKVEYLNKVTQMWTCYTGRVEYPERIGELLGSCQVELWTLTDGFRPVNIKATQADLLTYKTNGRKPVEFTFDIEIAQDRYRR